MALKNGNVLNSLAFFSQIVVTVQMIVRTDLMNVFALEHIRRFISNYFFLYHWKTHSDIIVHGWKFYYDKLTQILYKQ